VTQTERALLVVAGVLLVAALFKRWQQQSAASSASALPGSSGTNILQRSPTQTGVGVDWINTRSAALITAGVTGPAMQAVLAQWALETGWGKAEWSFNVGNIKALPGQAYQVLADGLSYAAYATLAEGVAAYLALVRDGARYKALWPLAGTDVRAWAKALAAAGYAELAPDLYAQRVGAAFDALTGKV
jgi:Mannosyl-glycoprotein endo-beta-N-acetylglucosaminidase